MLFHEMYSKMIHDFSFEYQISKKVKDKWKGYSKWEIFYFNC